MAEVKERERREAGEGRGKHAFAWFLFDGKWVKIQHWGHPHNISYLVKLTSCFTPWKVGHLDMVTVLKNTFCMREKKHTWKRDPFQAINNRTLNSVDYILKYCRSQETGSLAVGCHILPSFIFPRKEVFREQKSFPPTIDLWNLTWYFWHYSNQQSFSSDILKYKAQQPIYSILRNDTVIIK